MERKWRGNGEEMENTMAINKKVLLVSIISIISIISLIIIVFIYSKNDEPYKKIIEILPDSYCEIKFSEDDAYKDKKFTKEIKNELYDFFIRNDAKELKKDHWLKIEPTKFIKILSDGKIKLLIYTAKHNTYIEYYENSKIVKTYIIEKDVTEKIKDIINVNVN